MSLTVRVPAKINLYLGVGARRDDGYHDVATVYQAVSLFDDVTVQACDDEAEPGTLPVSLTVHGEGADQVPLDEDNLAARAARAVELRTGAGAAVRIDIRKNIPVAGGMAGGSADAAGALLACDASWGAGLDRAALLELAAGLGADVPFALMGGTALGVGRGEQLSPVLASGTFHWVFAFANSGLSTKAVYEELDRGRDGTVVPDTPDVPEDLLMALRTGDAVALGESLANDLQAPALRLYPGLRRTLEAGRRIGALGAMVCGSGPTCAFLASSADAALALAAELSGEGVCRSVRYGHGPVTGAQVLA